MPPMPFITGVTGLGIMKFMNNPKRGVVDHNCNDHQ
jgi:hypothetical protein